MISALVLSLLTAATFMAARNEVDASGRLTAAKKAYYAAQAGVSYYLQHLEQNGSYLSYCTELSELGIKRTSNPETNENPVNVLYASKTGGAEIAATNLYKVNVPGTEHEEETFAIQLLPAQSAPSSDKECDREHLYETMIEHGSEATDSIFHGTFRIRSTGFADHGKVKRSIVATFKNAGFLDFVYYTEFETASPRVYPTSAEGYGSHSGSEAEKYCEKPYGERASWCTNIYFGGSDAVNGPMHTQDHIGVLGSPTFGSEATDPIEILTTVNSGCGNPDHGYSEEEAGSGCSVPNFVGTLKAGKTEVKSLTPPPSDSELEKWGESTYGGLTFTGATEIILNGTTIEARKPTASGEAVTEYAWPKDGVIYVANNGACNEEYHQYGATYPGMASCGNAYVRGKYSKSLTIAGANDVIIDGSIRDTNATEAGKPLGTASLGLIAQGFVRVYHPVKTSGHTDSFTGCNAPSISAGSAENPVAGSEGTMGHPVIDAGILALNGSFLVDNFRCPEGGGAIGNLTVYGALAQKFRGVVGTSEPTGYVKDYHYDNRLAAGEPPHFLNPVEASWQIVRETLGPAPN